MRPADIIAHLRVHPFVPIRIYMSDGATYDVRHPELALASRTELCIALRMGQDGVPEDLVYCDPVHVTRIQPLRGLRKNGTKRKSA